LLAAIRLDYICQLRSEPRLLIEKLDALPTTMTAAYVKTMDRIFERGPVEKALALRTLSWVFHASAIGTRPIQMEELVQLLYTREGDKDIEEEHLPKRDVIILLCEGLVVCDETDSVRFSHLTVEDFLESQCSFLRFQKWPKSVSLISLSIFFGLRLVGLS
jgi:hypothetical protein